MSSVDDHGAPPALPEWDRAERAVRRLLEDRDAWQRRATLAEHRVRELESALSDVSAGTLDPLQLSEQADRLERENRVLHERLAQARETVDRILDRIDFAGEEP
ncbi:MAG: hypothetical protein L0271_20560 [Gemmatimonadetes bacterium]|nr:hypothetical protein [Gemmatimonadota bacterium]